MGRGLAGPALDTGGLGHWRLSLAWRRKCFRRSRRQRDGTGLAAALLPRGKRGQDGRLPRSATATRLTCGGRAPDAWRGRLRPGLWTSGAGPGGSRSAPRLRRGLSAQHRCATGGDGVPGVTPPSRPTGPAGRRFRVSGLGGQQSLGHGHTAGHGCPRASREPWGQFFRIAPWELKTKLRKQTLCVPLPLFPGGFNTGFF